METRKIAIACFIGGVICSATALLFAPAYWWLGLLSGFAGGYISYEFRQVLKAIPVAWRSAQYGCSEWWNGVIQNTKNWLVTPHPFLYAAIIISICGWSWFFSVHNTLPSPTEGNVNFMAACCTFGILMYAFTAIINVILMAVAVVGVNAGERFRPDMEYTRAFKTFGNGLGEIIMFFGWTLWKYLLIGIWKITIFLCRFVRFLFRLIHSEKRLLCGVDGTIGGVVSYFWLAPSATSTAGHFVLVLFGGLLGAGLGILNWEIVSKRMLHIISEES